MNVVVVDVINNHVAVGDAIQTHGAVVGVSHSHGVIGFAFTIMMRLLLCCEDRCEADADLEELSESTKRTWGRFVHDTVSMLNSNQKWSRGCFVCRMCVSKLYSHIEVGDVIGHHVGTVENHE